MHADALQTAATPLRLFNGWQRGLPLVARPFDELGAPHGLAGAQVRALLRQGIADGQISRVGAVFGVGAGGAATLCALRVAPADLPRVAACVDAEAGVNHNYAREHEWNLWFVVTAADASRLHANIERIESATGLRALRLPMRRAYRIDLGFDLFNAHQPAVHAPHRGESAGARVPPAQWPLAARLEDGLALVERPFAALGEQLGLGEAHVIATLRDWCESGALRRLGVVLRHHEAGFTANAMTVFDVPPQEVDAAGARLARQPGVTLCYQRERGEGWPYTLYCMVHGRERAAVQALVDRATHGAGLAGRPRQVLFSTKRFKQTGGRYFERASS